MFISIQSMRIVFRSVALLSACAVAMSLGTIAANAAPTSDTLDAASLIASIAPDKARPTSPEATLTIEQQSDSSRVTISDGRAAAPVSVNLPPALRWVGQRDDFEVLLSTDDRLAVSVKATVDGGQMVFAIDDASHLNELRTSFDLLEGARQLMPAPANGAYIYPADGPALYVSQPWARDASGKDISAHFELVDEKLVQALDATEGLQLQERSSTGRDSRAICQGSEVAD